MMTLAEKLIDLIDQRDQKVKIDYRGAVDWMVQRCEENPDEGFALAYINLLGININPFVTEAALAFQRVPNGSFAAKLHQLNTATQYGATEEEKVTALAGPTMRFFEAMAEIGQPIQRHPETERLLRSSGLDLDTLPWASE